MLAEFFDVKVPVYISLMVIVICLAGSIGYSIQVADKKE
jgi:tellurite resistance protein TerC